MRNRTCLILSTLFMSKKKKKTHVGSEILPKTPVHQKPPLHRCGSGATFKSAHRTAPHRGKPYKQPGFTFHAPVFKSQSA
jgi:hypothetical protein